MIRAKACFMTDDGVRTALFFFDLAESSQIPVFAEPFFQGADAMVGFRPVMNVEELQKGLSHQPWRIQHGSRPGVPYRRLWDPDTGSADNRRSGCRRGRVPGGGRTTRTLTSNQALFHKPDAEAHAEALL